MALSKNEAVKPAKNDAVKLARGFLAHCSHRHAIQKADLFGSFTRGTACGRSDIDLAVILEKEQSSKDSIYAEDFEIFHEAQQFTSLLEAVCLRRFAFPKRLLP